MLKIFKKNLKYFFIESDKRWILFLVWVLLLVNNDITIKRLTYFIIIIIFITLYVSIYRYLIFGYFIHRTGIQTYIKNNKDLFSKINLVLIKIQKWRNPLLVFLVYVDHKQAIFYKWLNYKIIKSRFKNQLLKETNQIYLEIVYFSINLMCLGILKIIIGLFYDSFANFKTLYFYTLKIYIINIFFKRMYGLILSILIFTDLIQNVINYIIMNGVLGLIKIYCLIILYYIIIFIYCTYIEKKNKENKIYSLFLKNYNNNIKKYLISMYLIDLHKYITLLGFLIEYIDFYKTYDEDLECSVAHKNSRIIYKEQLQSNYIYTYKKAIFNSMFENTKEWSVQCNEEEVVHYVYISGRYNVLLYKDVGLFYSYLEVNFKYIWYYYKYIQCNINLTNKIYEIKNYPSFFLYNYLLYNIWEQNCDDIVPLNALMNWMFYKKRIEELKLEVSSEVQEALNFMYNFDLKRLRLLLYMIWDIEESLENPCKDYLILGKRFLIKQEEEKDGRINMANKQESDILCLHINQKNIKQNPLLKRNYKFKKENAFYDIDQNMEFFEKFFQYYIIFDITFKHLGFSSNYESINYYIATGFIKYINKRLFLWKEIEVKYLQEGLSFNRIKNYLLNPAEQSAYELVLSEAVLNIKSELKFEYEQSKVEEIGVRNKRLLLDLEEYYNSFKSK